MKLNLGCGSHRLAGYVNVDASPVCNPDLVFDLDTTPWPWPDDSVREIILSHVLEHLGATTAGFLAIVRELYRVCAPGGRVRIVVPHPRHDNFLNDPTHVRAVTPTMMALFDRQLNEEWQARGHANTPLGLQLGVDFRIVEAETLVCEPYRTDDLEGRLSGVELDRLIAERSNVAHAFRIELEARKSFSARDRR